MIRDRAILLTFLLQLVFLLSFPYNALSQSKDDMKKIFAEAESCSLYEEYDLANPLYLLLERPDNYNIQYKIGTCYLNIPGEKGKSIPYLESAVKHSSYDANPASFREKRAPLDSYFFLGKAYMINNELDKALTTFQAFKRLADEVKEKGSMKNLPYIDQEISACQLAIDYRKNPTPFSKRNLGNKINQGSVNENPAVSFDGNTIVYTERRGLNNAIMFSRKINGAWQMPIEINSELSCGEDCSSSSLNSDGTLLFLYKTDNYDGNIYSSEFKDDKWSQIKKLNRNINTKYYESHASVSYDGKKLYFTSNREGGSGGLDIYVSEKDQAGDWGPAVNLGNSVNSPFNEDDPFITRNDSILYLSSEGHNTMGGFDIFRVKLSGGSPGPVENLGYPLNSTDDDKFFQPFNNEKNGFYSMTTGYKKKEIFYVALANTGQLVELTGKYGLKDTVVTFGEKNPIYVLDRKSGDTLDTQYPEKESGLYSFYVTPGVFRLAYTAPGYMTEYIDTSAIEADTARAIRLRDVLLEKRTGAPAYAKLDLSNIPVVPSIDSSILIRNMKVIDVTDNDVQDTSILYYTVQVMALYNPVDISYFKYVSDIRVFYNDNDRFYRYTTGVFKVKNDAYGHKAELIAKGYPDDLFVKKVMKLSSEAPVKTLTYFSIQLKASKAQVDIASTFPGIRGIRETKEVDGMYHYLYGRYTSIEEARSAISRPEFKQFSDAFVREIGSLIKNK